jgi:hypothetical protein
MVLLWRVWILWGNEFMNNKKHTDYLVTNVAWHLSMGELYRDIIKTGCTTTGYLDIDIFKNINYWYVRDTGYYMYLFGQKHIDPISKRSTVMDKDPWYRRFKAYPPEESTNGGVMISYVGAGYSESTHHRYYTFRNLTKIVNVMVTTVNGEPVYCVDNIELVDQPIG